MCAALENGRFVLLTPRRRSRFARSRHTRRDARSHHTHITPRRSGRDEPARPSPRPRARRRRRPTSRPSRAASAASCSPTTAAHARARAAAASRRPPARAYETENEHSERQNGTFAVLLGFRPLAHVRTIARRHQLASSHLSRRNSAPGVLLSCPPSRFAGRARISRITGACEDVPPGSMTSDDKKTSEMTAWGFRNTSQSS